MKIEENDNYSKGRTSPIYILVLKGQISTRKLTQGQRDDQKY